MDKDLGQRLPVNHKSRQWYSIALVSVFVIVTMILSFSFIYRNSIQNINDDAWVSHTHEVIAHIESLSAVLIDIETGMRGFVITGKEEFLEPYRRSSAVVAKQVEEIRELTRDNPAQQENLKMLEPLIREKFEISDKMIETRTRKGLASAASIVTQGEGKRIMDQIRIQLGAMLNEENRLLLKRLETSSVNSQNANLQFILISLIDISTVLFAFWILNLNTRKRIRAEISFDQAKENYQVRATEAMQSSIEARVASERTALFREEILANMYHELRTPLTSIIGFSEMLKEDSEVHSQTQEAGEAIYRNGKHLLALIENLLSASEAIRAGKPLEAAEIPILPILRSASNKMLPAMEAKRIRFEIRPQSKNSLVKIHPGRLQTALEQLLDNAIKFSEVGGRITIDVQELDRRVNICIVDEGIGIGRESLPQMFEAFHQGDGSFTRTHGGMGIGLFVARLLVETYGGTLHAHSEGLGKGAKFVMTFPALEKERQKETLASN